MKGEDYQTPPSAPLHLQITPKHHWKPQNTLRHLKYIPLSPRNSLGHSQALFRQSERHLSCQRKSGGTLGEMRVSEDVFWVSGMLVSVYGCLWKCLGYVRGDMGVSRDIWGCLWEVGGPTGGWEGCLAVFSLHLPSILGSHRLDSWHLPVDLAVPDVSNIKMSQSCGRFELLGSLGRGFKAEL